MTKRYYLPVIEASDGREYVNVYYNTMEDAEDALAYFIEVFKEYHDDAIVKAYVR